LIKPAGGYVIGLNDKFRRLFDFAQSGNGVRTAGWKRSRSGGLTRLGAHPGVLLLKVRAFSASGSEVAPASHCVGMLGVVGKVADLGLLDNLTGVHDKDALGEVANSGRSWVM